MLHSSLGNTNIFDSSYFVIQNIYSVIDIEERENFHNMIYVYIRERKRRRRKEYLKKYGQRYKFECILQIIKHFQKTRELGDFRKVSTNKQLCTLYNSQQWPNKSSILPNCKNAAVVADLLSAVTKEDPIPKGDSHNYFWFPPPPINKNSYEYATTIQSFYLYIPLTRVHSVGRHIECPCLFSYLHVRVALLLRAIVLIGMTYEL